MIRGRLVGPSVAAGLLAIALIGGLATALVLSGLFGWPLLLQPIVDALGGAGSASLVRAAILGVGAVMAAKWTIAWLSYLPRGSARATAS